MSTMDLADATQPLRGGPKLEPPSEPHANFEKFIELSSDKVGGKVLFATDEFFAAADNVIKADDPVWKEGLFTEQGKWMDGWESRRKRTVGHDWCIIKLGIPGVIKGVLLDTAYFTGNNAPAFSIEGSDDDQLLDMLPPYSSVIGHSAKKHSLLEAENAYHRVKWTELVSKSALRPGYQSQREHHFPVFSQTRWKYLRLNMFPDGGIARLRVYGVVQPDWDKLSANGNGLIDLISVLNGGSVHSWSDTHYGHPSLLLNPGSGVDMGDGWETARKKTRPNVYEANKEGHLELHGSEWCILQLGTQGTIHHIDVDTSHFKGNFPESFEVEGACGVWHEQWDFGEWFPVVHRQKLEADNIDRFVVEGGTSPPTTHIRLRIFPDGGVSRIRVFGTPILTAKM